MAERRSTDRCSLTMELPGLPPPPPAPPHGQGVGARRAGRRPLEGGGGYLNGRTASELRRDPRLAELAEIGLSSTWLAIASTIGYDQFVVVWRYLSADPALRNDSNQIALTLRPFRAYERYQRNRYIETLVHAGLERRQIHEIVHDELGEELTRRQLNRLLASARIRR